MELQVVQQNLFGAEAFDHPRRISAFIAFLHHTRPHVVTLQELLPWSVRALLGSPSLRKLYPHVRSDLLADSPWTYVLTSLPRLRRDRIEGMNGGLDLSLINVSGRALAVGSVHLSPADCPSSETQPLKRHAPCPGGVKRADELKEALHYLSTWAKADHRLLLGDFNFGDSPHLFPAEQTVLAEQRAKYVDAWLVANHSMPGYTWDNRYASHTIGHIPARRASPQPRQLVGARAGGTG